MFGHVWPNGQDVVRMLMTRAFQEDAVTWQRLLKRLGPELDEAIDIEDGNGDHMGWQSDIKL